MIYPKRDPYFAQRYTRLMAKTCAAQEIGQSAALLCVMIAATEDSARYRGPVTFWNSQLQQMCGFSKWDILDRARRKAIGAGWLQYHVQGTRQAGAYFVTIPPQFQQLADAIVEPSLSPESGGKADSLSPESGGNKGGKADSLAAESGGNSGGNSGDNEGEPSILSLTPIPSDNIQPLNDAGAAFGPTGTQAFKRFWAAYPKKVARADAGRALVRALARTGNDIERIVAGITTSPQLQGDVKFMPKPAAWLDGDGWDDEPHEPKTATGDYRRLIR